MQLYALQVLASRLAVPRAILECYRPLFRCLSLEQAEEVLLPALVRVVKRLPEVMLPVMEAVLEMLEVHLTDYAVVTISELLPQLRHPKEAVRYLSRYPVDGLQIMSFLARIQCKHCSHAANTEVWLVGLQGWLSSMHSKARSEDL